MFMSSRPSRSKSLEAWRPDCHADCPLPTCAWAGQTASAIVGFVVGAVIAMGAVALATGTGHGWIVRDVLRRPVVRAMAALFVLVFAAMLASPITWRTCCRRAGGHTTARALLTVAESPHDHRNQDHEGKHPQQLQHRPALP
jgi:hypothetical protein